MQPSRELGPLFKGELFDCRLDFRETHRGISLSLEPRPSMLRSSGAQQDVLSSDAAAIAGRSQSRGGLNIRTE
jgi:hypothetical protein